MGDYRPQQRTVPARILTPSGWVRGAFHVPRLQSFAEFLAHESPFLSLTDVSLPGSADELPFLALRRGAALLILPSCDERRLLLRRELAGAVRDVTCVLSAGAVHGRLALVAMARLSDYLAHQTGFLMLREVDLGPARTRVPILFLNATALLAVAERARAPTMRHAAAPPSPKPPLRVVGPA